VASRREEKQEEVRLRVLRLISCDPEMSSRQVAAAIGISNGSAYYILTALVEKGFVKLENFKQNPRKGSYAHLLTPKGIREKSLLTHRFIKHKRREFADLRAEIEALEHEAGLTVVSELASKLNK
jgi:EPS-associated MarR family transcriptional regulator